MPYTNTEKAIIGYMVASTAAFLLGGANVMEGSFPDVKKETCYRKVCTETLAYTVGSIYFQVVAAMSAMVALLVAYPGQTGQLGAMGAFIAVQAKHILVDGLIPPPPVMAMTAIVSALVAFKPGKLANNALKAFSALNVASFTLAPGSIVTDTWPDATEGTEAATVGVLMVEVLALYMAIMFVLVALPKSQTGYLLAWSLCAPVMLKHVLIDNSGPPPAMRVVYVLIAGLIWKEHGVKIKATAEAAIKKPMKYHGLIAGSSFVPYFLAESFGISVPVVGLSQLSSDYSFDSTTGFLLAMLAVMVGYVAKVEVKGEMKGKHFWAYHIFLSIFVAFWQCQPTTSTLGKAFFSVPHVFTLWSSYIAATGVKLA